MNRINTIKNKIKEYEYKPHTLTTKSKINYDNYFRFEDNYINLLDFIFYIFTVMFGFTLKYEENNNLVSNNFCLCFYKLYLCN